MWVGSHLLPLRFHRLSPSPEFLERPENRDSLLCRFLGCFEYTPPGGSTPVIAVLMNNLLETNLRIEHVFDMKGSR